MAGRPVQRSARKGIQAIEIRGAGGQRGVGLTLHVQSKAR
jgi:hypothetical protein